MKTRIFLMGVAISCLAGSAGAGENYSAIQARLGIPASIASVVDASGRWPQFILIQDIHRHPEVQNNIAAMILYGLKHWETKEIFVEGSWSQLDIRKSSGVIDPSISGSARGRELTGPELAVAMARQDVRLLGLEEQEIYRANVSAYNAVEQARPQALRELETARLLGRVADAEPRSWDQLKRLIELCLKPADYAGYRKNPFRPAAASALAGAVLSAELYYELANERSRVFLQRARALHQSGPQVLVVGGFHTAAMAEELRSEGAAFVVLSPRVTQGGFGGLYAQGMRDTISALKLR